MRYSGRVRHPGAIEFRRRSENRPLRVRHPVADLSTNLSVNLRGDSEIMSKRSRAPFQVLVIPYILSNSDGPRYAVFRRPGYEPALWQWIAGGGESGETPIQAARRESAEEAGISAAADFMTLRTVSSIPVFNFPGTDWPDDLDVVPEYAFAVEIDDPVLTLSSEHVEYRWLDYRGVIGILKWDSNRTALWELQRRLIREGRIPRS